MKPGAFGKVTLWFATVVAVVVFLMAGAGKLMAAPPNPQGFAHWGFPPWMMYAVGAAEVLGALMLLWPRAAPFGAALLAAVMVGAVTVHLVFREWSALMLPLVLLALLALVGTERAAWLRTRWAQRTRAEA
jgi:uncharacterized membrane protein YphA (DoxX/SURF4 family)